VPPTEVQIGAFRFVGGLRDLSRQQRGLSSRTIPHTEGFARRFLDYRFGESVIDPGRLRPADAIGFMEHVLASARHDKTGGDPCPHLPSISVRMRGHGDQSGVERAEDGQAMARATARAICRPMASMPCSRLHTVCAARAARRQRPRYVSSGG